MPPSELKEAARWDECKEIMFSYAGRGLAGGVFVAALARGKVRGGQISLRGAVLAGGIGVGVGFGYTKCKEVFQPPERFLSRKLLPISQRNENDLYWNSTKHLALYAAVGAAGGALGGAALLLRTLSTWAAAVTAGTGFGVGSAWAQVKIAYAMPHAGTPAGEMLEQQLEGVGDALREMLPGGFDRLGELFSGRSGQDERLDKQRARLERLKVAMAR